jgi:hypothetical protein
MSSQAGPRKAQARGTEPLPRPRAHRLSRLTNIASAEFVRRSLAEISAKYRWDIEPFPWPAVAKAQVLDLSRAALDPTPDFHRNTDPTGEGR